MNERSKPLERIKKESRKHPRIAVYLSVSASNVPVLEDHSLCSYNLSRGGMMIVAVPPLKDPADIDIGGRTTVSFTVSTKEGTFNIPSQTVWVKHNVLTPEGEKASCIGVKFLELSERIAAVIDTFLKEGPVSKQEEAKSHKKTCRDCVHFKDNAGSRYAYCKLHRITVLNSEADLTMSFNQIYTYPCQDLKTDD